MAPSRKGLTEKIRVIRIEECLTRKRLFKKYLNNFPWYYLKKIYPRNVWMMNGKISRRTNISNILSINIEDSRL